VRNVRALSQIVNDVLDVSGMVSGKTRLDPEETDLCEVIEAALENFEAHGYRQSISSCTSSWALPRVSSLENPHRLQQIMWNLLSNAVKFTPRRGRVR